MYVNGKMRHVETIPGMRGCEIKENDGEGEFNYDIRNAANVTMYLQYSNNKNRSINKYKENVKNISFDKLMLTTILILQA
jgi:hypothetical protein